MSNSLANYIWYEKHRPTSLDQLVLEPQTSEIFARYIADLDIPHLLFYGRAGSGKTTLAQILCTLLPCTYITLNASGEERSIDTMRTTVAQFARSMPSKDVKLKVVFLDECLGVHETVRVGTTDAYTDIPLENLDFDRTYPVVSMNMETGELENDEAFLCVDKDDDLYEVTLSNGQVITCNAKHPFVIRELGRLVKRRVEEGIEGAVCVFC